MKIDWDIAIVSFAVIVLFSVIYISSKQSINNYKEVENCIDTNLKVFVRGHAYTVKNCEDK